MAHKLGPVQIEVLRFIEGRGDQGWTKDRGLCQDDECGGNEGAWFIRDQVLWELNYRDFQ